MSIRQWFYRNVYLKTPYWKSIRRGVGKRANWTCQVKGCKVSAHNLDAHHTTYKILWFEWLFPWLMVYLCRVHHIETHHWTPLTLKNGKTLKPYKRTR